MLNLKSQIVRRHRLALILAVVLAIIAALNIFRAKFTSPIDSYAACVEAGYPVTLSEPPVCREGSHNFIGTPHPALPTSAPTESVEFSTLVDGDTHNVLPDHEQHLITSPALWSAYWNKVHAGLSSVPPLLPVDFTKSDVIGVSLGAHVTNGYGLKVTSITTGPRGTTVNITESTPTITCSVTKQTSNRYLIVRTASKLVQPVSFRIASEKRHC